MPVGLLATHGAPECLRSDNGPQYVAVAVAVSSGLARQRTTTLDIALDCPWQHGVEERFNRTRRDEGLNRQAFL